MNLQRSLPALTVAAGVLFGAAPPAYSQSSQVIEEVIVTATKREQSAQDVPIAITAFSGENLEAKAVNMVEQIGDSTSNLYTDSTTPFGAGNNVLAAYIRGIGQQDFAFNLEPGVGVYIDGVYLARTVGANADLLDVERVEVLKGPQGTLFGRNTLGGAISIITRQPGNEFNYRAEVTTGSYDRIDFRGAIDGPLIQDKLFGSFAMSVRNRDGYQKRIPYPGALGPGDDDFRDFLHVGYETSNTAGGEDQQNYRGKLVWDINEQLSVMLVAAYNNTDEEAVPNSLLAYYDNTVPGASFTNLADTCVSLPPAVIDAIPLPPCQFNRGIKTSLPSVGAPFIQQPALYGNNADGDPSNDRTLFGNNPGGLGSPFILSDKDKSYATAFSFNDLQIEDYYGHVDYDLPNGWHLKYIGSYRDLDWEAGFDFDGSPLSMLEVSFSTYQKQWSHELQFSGSSWEDRWQWVLGGYYFHEEGDLTDYVTFPAGFLQIYGENEFDTDAWAVFMHNTVALTDRLSLTLGLRYTDEDKKFEGRQRDLNMVSVNPGIPTGCEPPPLGCGFDAWPDQNDFTRYYPLGVNSNSFTDTSIVAGIEYNFSDDVMGYLSYSEGFKSGGWTTRLSAPALTTEPSPIAPRGLAFDEETAKTYELGLKSQLLENSLQLNAALFFTKYDNIQITLQEGASPVFANAGDGKITGVEVDAIWVATPSLLFEAGVGWLDARYTDIDPNVYITTIGDVPPSLDGTLPAGFVDPVTGERSPKIPLSDDYDWVNVPKWDINLAATYTVALNGGAGLDFRVDYAHTSKLANDISNTPELNQGALDIFNASVTFTAASDRWQVQGGGRNITDERHIVTGQVQPAAGMINGTWSRPAEWFLTLRIRN
jgi:iron complex outermembrane receptor protein